MLSFILKNGNVTVFQWKHGDAPTLKQNLNTRNGNNETDFNIDWGSESGMVSRHDDGIDFGGIDFGDLELEGAEVDLSCITLEDSGDGGVALQGGDGANDYINEKQDYTGTHTTVSPSASFSLVTFSPPPPYFNPTLPSDPPSLFLPPSLPFLPPPTLPPLPPPTLPSLPPPTHR